MKKKYFFGYLFVRLAKTLAVLTLLSGVGSAVFLVVGARLAGERASYGASFELRQQLRELGEEWERSQRLVGAFKPTPEGSPAVAKADFPAEITTLAQFSAVFARFDGIERGRDAMKALVVERFNELTRQIEVKLRAHAAQLAAAREPAPNSTAASPAPSTSATPRTPAPAADHAETLFEALPAGEISTRIERLGKIRDFLQVLETEVENPENRQILGDSLTEIAALEKLLPRPFVPPPPTAPAVAPSATPAAPASPAQAKLKAEKVAEQLAQFRGSVQETLLTSWRLDHAFTAARSLAHAEHARCIAANLAVKAIWLSAAGKIAATIASAVFVAFLILVFADLLQTFFDTATATGAVADAYRQPAEASSTE